MTRSFLRPLLLMICVIATLPIAGCNSDTGTGHVEDKTGGGTPTPAAETLMDSKAMDDYSAEQAKKAADGTTGTP